MRKILFWLILLLPMSLFGQTPSYPVFSGTVTNSLGQAVPNATVIVLSGTITGAQAVNTTIQPGAPLATICRDPYCTTVINQSTSPLKSDGSGNFTFASSSGWYVLQMYGPGIYGQQITQISLSAGGGSSGVCPGATATQIHYESIAGCAGIPTSAVDTVAKLITWEYFFRFGVPLTSMDSWFATTLQPPNSINFIEDGDHGPGALVINDQADGSNHHAHALLLQSLQTGDEGEATGLTINSRATGNASVYGANINLDYAGADGADNLQGVTINITNSGGHQIGSPIGLQINDVPDAYQTPSYAINTGSKGFNSFGDAILTPQKTLAEINAESLSPGLAPGPITSAVYYCSDCVTPATQGATCSIFPGPNVGAMAMVIQGVVACFAPDVGGGGGGGNTTSTSLVSTKLPIANGANSIIDSGIAFASSVLTVPGQVVSDATGFCIAASCITAWPSGGGGGISTISVGDLPPLFTTVVTNPTSTPAVAYTLTNAAAHTVFGNFTAGSAAPGFTAAPTFSAANLTNFPTFNQSTTGNADTASASDHSISSCPGGQFATGLSTAWALTCAAAGSGISYPPAGVPLSIGSAWGTSYSTSGSGNICLTTNCVMTTPNLGTPSAIVLTNATGAPTWNQNTNGTAANLSGTPTLPNGTAATTQATSDNTTKLATTAFVKNVVGTQISNATTTVNASVVFGANKCYSASGVLNAPTIVTMTGLASTNTLDFTFNADPTGITGWGAVGGLVIRSWPISNAASYEVCNQTSSSITTSGSVTFNISAK